MGLPTVGGVSKARGAEEPLGSGTMAHSAVGPSQVLKLLWMGLPTDVKQYYCGWVSPQVFERLLWMGLPTVVRNNTVDGSTHSFINSFTVDGSTHSYEKYYRGWVYPRLREI
jgi:hypothetical protein